MQDKVHCANCLREVVDEGTGQTCTHCGCSPVPSYSYSSDSPFYPTNCNCAVVSSSTVVRKRRVPLPDGPILNKER